MATRYGSNVEIYEQLGEDNIFMFEVDISKFNKVKTSMKNYKPIINGFLKTVLNIITSGVYGIVNFFNDNIKMMIKVGDIYMVFHDFNEYVEAQLKAE